MGAWSDLTHWLRGKPKEEDRRESNRLPVHDQAEVSWRTDGGPEKRMPANLIDVSEAGFKARCSEEVAVGTQVTLRDSTGRAAAGVVVYSARDDDAYLIGAQAEWESRTIEKVESGLTTTL